MIKPIKILKFLNQEKAQTMVEFALVFPLVLMITYGIIEFGRMVFIYADVTGAAREGARYGVAAGIGPNGIVQFADCKGIRDAVRKTAFLISIPDSSITIQYDNGTTIQSACPPPTNSIKLGDRVIVHVEVRYEPIIGTFLGVNGFVIPSTNYRTILMDIKIATPTYSLP